MMNGHGDVEKSPVAWAITTPAPSRAVETHASIIPTMSEAPQHGWLRPRSRRCATASPSAGYLASEAAALVSFLAYKLGKPVLVEGPAGVGKTELAKALSRYTRRRLVRLQCYEGLDEAKALYEWNYRKQLLRIQTEAAGTAWQDVQEDIFSEDFLMARPLLTAISVEEPVVLLIDEIDKTDQEFEAMLLEVLSDFQISIPELGVVEATTQPAGAADLQQHPRADRGAEAPLPLPVARLPGRRARARDRAAARARAAGDDHAPADRDHPHGAQPRPQEAALDRGVDRLGARAAAARRDRHRPLACSSAR